MAKSMLIFTKTGELKAYLNVVGKHPNTIGFVPTMGALHGGHVSLIALSKKWCDITVCSIFVNPTQFNDKKDLERYPRMPEKDIRLLEKAGCEVVFLPTVEQVYPNPESESFDFGYLSNTLEGKHRPGHFNGVAQVVKRFFEIVVPTKAFFGSKDYQQVMIIKELVKQMGSPIEVVSCPILREENGVAMSSRNTLLNMEEKAQAAFIPKILYQANLLLNEKGVDAAKKFVEHETRQLPLFRLDYYEICEAHTLKIATHLYENEKYVALIACFVGRIRLIDNLPVLF